MMMNDTLLDVKDLNVSYQTLHVLFDVSIEIKEGEVVVVVGRGALLGPPGGDTPPSPPSAAVPPHPLGSPASRGP